MDDTIFIDEFPKTAMNRKSGDIYSAANQGPVSIAEYGTSRYVLMSRRHFDQFYSRQNPQLSRANTEIPDLERKVLISELDKLIAGDD